MSKKRVGRRTKYHTNVEPVLDRIPAWRKQGLTEEQVAKKCGVAYSTFNNYKKEYLTLVEALKIGKEQLIEQLEDSLYKSAMGFHYNEIETIDEKDETGAVIYSKTRKTRKYANPNVTSIIWHLKTWHLIGGGIGKIMKLK